MAVHAKEQRIKRQKKISAGLLNFDSSDTNNAHEL